MCELFADSGIIVLAAFASPYGEDGDEVRSLLGTIGGRSIRAGVSTCEESDTNGLYKLARSGKIPNSTVISAPFEAPENPEVVLDSGEKFLEDCVSQLIAYLKDGGYLSTQE